MNNENEIKNKNSFLQKIKPLDCLNKYDENNDYNIKYIKDTSNKSRNKKKDPHELKNVNKKYNTSFNKSLNKKNNKFIFRSTDNRNKSNSINLLYEEITIISSKYISLSCDKIINSEIYNKDLIPLKYKETHKKSACNLTRIINLNNQKRPKYSYNTTPKKITPSEIHGNTEIITNIHIKKIINSTENSNIDELNNDKNSTNINSILNLNIDNNIQYVIDQIKCLEPKNEINSYDNFNCCQNQSEYLYKRMQLDSIMEEENEEENYSKNKSKNKDKDKEINYLNAISFDNFNKNYINFSNEKDRKNNILSSATEQSTRLGTIKNNNIFDISSEDDNCDKNIVINYIENTNIENENKINTDIDHDSEKTYLLKPINPNENDNSLSFINDSDINKFCNSPSKKGFIFINSNNNYINNNLPKQFDNLNNSAFIKKTNSFDEFKINFPQINNIFKRKKNDYINNNNLINNNKTYIKKQIKNSFKNNSKNLKGLISPKNINQYEEPKKKIKEIILPLNKNKKKFENDIHNIQKINKQIFEFDNYNDEIKALSMIKTKMYIKRFFVPSTKIKKISIDLNMNFEELNFIIKKYNKDNLSYKNKSNYESYCSNNNDNINISTVMTTFDKCSNIPQQNSDNKIKNGNDIINKFKLNEKKIDNSHIRNRSRNKIDPNNSLFFIKSSSFYLSNGYNSSEIKQENSYEKYEKGKIMNNDNKSAKMEALNNIIISSNKEKINDNYLSFAENNLDDGKFCISVKSYEEFIKHFINQTENLKNKLLTNKNSQIIENNQNTNKFQDIDDLVVELEKEIKFLKYNNLCVLIEKHFTKSRKEKLAIIKKANMQNKRKKFFLFYQNMLNKIKDKLIAEYMIIQKRYMNKILAILEKYKTLDKFDIKYTKKIFKEEGKISPEILNDRFNKFNKGNNIEEENKNIIKSLKSNNTINKKMIIAASVIIPIIYGINYLMYFYKNYQ